LQGSKALLVSRFGKEAIFLFTIMITTKIMDTSGIDYMETSLITYIYPFANVATKLAEPQKEYQIPMDAVLDILRSFLGDGSRSALDYL
jgi:hypothetical protein